jgi:ribosomal protein S18 acetylase RimI-like enzyme
MIRTCEELSLNAWPGLQQMAVDGWLLRFAGGYTRRANAVIPLYPGTRTAEEKIAFCEALYAARGLATTVKLTAESHPEGLETLLAARGYCREAETLVMTRPLDAPPAVDDVTLLDAPTPRWLDAYASATGQSSAHDALHAAILDAIPVPKRLALVVADGAPVAVGLGVLERGHLGLFDLATHPAHRRRGHATRLMHALAAWAHAEGARHTYLQVMADNAPAITLYTALGYAEAYRYWYRIRPV